MFLGEFFFFFVLMYEFSGSYFDPCKGFPVVVRPFLNSSPLHANLINHDPLTCTPQFSHHQYLFKKLARICRMFLPYLSGSVARICSLRAGFAF